MMSFPALNLQSNIGGFSSHDWPEGSVFFWGGLLATSKPLINDDQNEKNEKQENL